MREPGSTTRQLTEELLRDARVSHGPLLEIGSRESIREAVLRNIGISIIARQEVPHDPQLRVLSIENAQGAQVGAPASGVHGAGAGDGAGLTWRGWSHNLFSTAVDRGNFHNIYSSFPTQIRQYHYR